MQSLGTGSFSSNTFNNKLKDAHGMSILQYVQGENFGKYGESMKLIENMNVSITKVLRVSSTANNFKIQIILIVHKCVLVRNS